MRSPSLTVQWIHGDNLRDARNSARYKLQMERQRSFSGPRHTYLSLSPPWFAVNLTSMATTTTTFPLTTKPILSAPGHAGGGLGPTGDESDALSGLC